MLSQFPTTNGAHILKKDNFMNIGNEKAKLVKFSMYLLSGLVLLITTGVAYERIKYGVPVNENPNFHTALLFTIILGQIYIIWGSKKES